MKKLWILAIFVLVFACHRVRAQETSTAQLVHELDQQLPDDNDDDGDYSGSVIPTNVKPKIVQQKDAATGAVLVSMTDVNKKAKIRYTLDGSTPTLMSPIYTQPIVVTKTSKLRAIAMSKKRMDSKVAKATVKVKKANG